jgi:hypothetical protein
MLRFPGRTSYAGWNKELLPGVYPMCITGMSVLNAVPPPYQHGKRLNPVENPAFDATVLKLLIGL